MEGTLLRLIASLFLIVFAAGLAQAEGYHLRPGDRIEVTVWQEPKLNRVVVVAPDGRISFPLAGRIKAGGTTVENLPWEECIKRYDRPHTFFYLDPPYWQAEGYGVPFDWAQYERISSTMRACKGKVMLSINAHPDIRSCFAGLATRELPIKYSVFANNGKPKQTVELVIMNYDIETGSGPP